jgi:predicted Zn-dependent protease
MLALPVLGIAYVSGVASRTLAAAQIEQQPDSQRQPIVVSPVQEYAWGEQRLRPFLQEHPLSSDSRLQLRVSRIGQNLARVSDRSNLLFRFFAIEGTAPQAYSFPGGTVCVTEALVRLYASDDELAFSIGHELSHIVLRHHVSRLRLQESFEPGTRSEQIRASVESFFDQDTEMEADRFGALYSVRAGYRYSATYEAMDRLSRVSRFQEDARHPDYGRRIKALRAFRRELELALQAFERGIASLEAGRPDDAIAGLRLFVGEFPNSVAGRINLGAAYLARVRLKAGTPQGLSEVLPILPEPGINVRNFVNILDLRHALGQFEEALSVQPQDSLAEAGLGLVYTRLGEYDRARAHLSHALSSDPDRPEILLCLGNIEYLSGTYSTAIFFYEEALKTQSDWPEAVKNLALTYERLEELELARQQWSKLIEHKTIGREASRHLARLERQKE